jgi:4-hydroxybenzoate polyprenyltransferase/phosphoglycolate phosphatase-like HAD superfamily hydrolase
MSEAQATETPAAPTLRQATADIVARPDTALPVVVDLDGTLVRTDTLVESLIEAMLRDPLGALGAIAALRQGRQVMKHLLAAIAPPDAATLPYRADLLAALHHRHAAGEKLHLVTAADQSIADAVAGELDLFASAHGSDLTANNKGAAKARYLAARFPDGFIYAGDSRADLPVWQASRGAILVGPAVALRAQVEAAGTKVLDSFPDSPISFRTWVRALRLHQWLKNLLLFVPLALSHSLGRPIADAKALLAFLLFGMVASATYLFNDLVDLRADRLHPSKYTRPLASGAIPITRAMVLGAALLAAGLVGSFLLAVPFGLTVCAYVGLTVLYSVTLKQRTLLDVAAIGMLFALRIVMGTYAIDVPFSAWLLSFSILFFCALAFAKRHTELIRLPQDDRSLLPNRGYRAADWPLTLAFGVSMSVASLIVMLLYIRLEAVQVGLYSRPMWLFAAPLGTLVWVMRVWARSHRGRLDDDPVMFAIKDKVSWGLAAVIGLALLAAV